MFILFQMQSELIFKKTIIEKSEILVCVKKVFIFARFLGS
jgi:hypothetical protein